MKQPIPNKYISSVWLFFWYHRKSILLPKREARNYKHSESHNSIFPDGHFHLFSLWIYSMTRGTSKIFSVFSKNSVTQAFFFHHLFICYLFSQMLINLRTTSCVIVDFIIDLFFIFWQQRNKQTGKLTNRWWQNHYSSRWTVIKHHVLLNILNFGRCWW